ncbi:MAG: hypothetical protein WBW41_10990 [Verrucomicrobiia bacterium]
MEMHGAAFVDAVVIRSRFDYWLSDISRFAELADEPADDAASNYPDFDSFCLGVKGLSPERLPDFAPDLNISLLQHRLATFHTQFPNMMDFMFADAGHSKSNIGQRVLELMMEAQIGSQRIMNEPLEHCPVRAVVRQMELAFVFRHLLNLPRSAAVVNLDVHDKA